jgi:electron transfer flavoprotein beta subunit
MCDPTAGPGKPTDSREKSEAMKIVTLIKYVPDATGDREFAEDGTVDREDSDGLLSELDAYAIEQALQIAEAGDDVEVVAMTLGPDDAADAVKKALQMGADSGVHICDEAVHGSDALATSAILAAAIRKAEPDLVICGMSSTDGTMGVIPAMLGERLGWPAATFGATLAVDGSTATIRRDGDVASQTIEVDLPAIVSVTDQSDEARYASMKGILAAKKKPVEDWELDDLDLELPVGLANAWSQVQQTEPKPPKEAGKQVIDEDGSGAAALTDFLVAGKYL